MSMSATYSKAHKARILLVAADPQMRKLLKSVLTAGGYGKCFVVDGSHTVQAEAASSFDLVVLDLDLPYSSGHSIIGEIRRSADVPVIAISGQAKEGDLVAALDLGADDYIAKSLRSSELLARIRSALRRACRAAVTLKTRAMVLIGKTAWCALMNRKSRSGSPCSPARTRPPPLIRDRSKRHIMMPPCGGSNPPAPATQSRNSGSTAVSAGRPVFSAR